jgi:hypothetical protein
LNFPRCSVSTFSTSVGRTPTALFTWMGGRIRRTFSRVTTVTPSVGGKAIRWWSIRRASTNPSGSIGVEPLTRTSFEYSSASPAWTPSP